MTTNLTALYGLGQSGSGQWKSQIFTTSGTWIKPENVQTIKVLLVGAGGSHDAAGQNSQFNASPFSFIAKGGGRYELIQLDNTTIGYRGGNGGGSESFIYTPVSLTSPDILFGNGGLDLKDSGISSNILKHGLLGITSGMSVSGGGGGAAGGNGGDVIGFGKGGTSSGGGGSFGNGGSLGQNGSYGGGGGGYSTSAGGGGGGGEIVIREIPITSSSATITIGTGAPGGTIYGGRPTTALGTAGAGGNGLCIIYWFE